MAAITTAVGLPVARRRSRRAVDILRHPTVVASALVLATVVFVAIAAPLIAPYDPYEQHLEGRLGSPMWAGGSFAHAFGTDQLGRDVLSRLMYGARVSIAIGVMAVIVSGVLGVDAGVTAGFHGGIVDESPIRRG